MQNDSDPSANKAIAELHEHIVTTLVRLQCRFSSKYFLIYVERNDDGSLKIRWQYRWDPGIPEFKTTISKIKGPLDKDGTCKLIEIYQCESKGTPGGFIIDHDILEGRTYLYKFSFKSERFSDPPLYDATWFPITIPLSTQSLEALEEALSRKANPAAAKLKDFLQTETTLDKLESEEIAKIRQANLPNAEMKIARIKGFLARLREELQ
jgi:hypothetical protein